MIKFDELCKAYVISRKNYFDYQFESARFIKNIIDNIIKYLEIPKEQIKLIPLDKEPEPNSKYTVQGAMHLNDDTFWHTGIQVTLYEAPNISPQQPVLIRLMVKKSENIYLVKIDPDEEGHKINPESNEDIQNFIDYISERIENIFKEGLQKFLEESASLKTIGFKRN